MRGNCTPVIVQCAEYLSVAALADTGANQYHHVGSAEQSLPRAEAFPYQPFHPVAFDGVAGGSDGHRGAKPGVVQPVAGRQHGDQPITGFVFAMLENPLVLGRRKQTTTAGITRRHQRAVCRGSG